ncbi:MAG: flagellar biosynthesis protein FlhA [Gammaproteobacteria bacterium]|nr:flagellar biosynthesis protein FlhA [Gammaproteobacteria bacterium]
MAQQSGNPLFALRVGLVNGAGLPLLLLAMLAMVVLPLPAILLDGLFTFNICLSLIVILAVVYVLRPLDLAAFPTVLLLATLLRLALNVASTRVVLLQGHTGTDAAGKVIEAFGEFVVGGNYAVGLVVFAILVIINFVVVTKGAGRVSEVSARFTLDALPGKQMAIDADLNAGIIDQEEAAARRNEIRTEADFYGSMDGASKFVRGDAIAGLLILFINLLGGMLIGTMQHDLSMADAAQTYALLTIGDGLVAQIPSLLLATAVAIIVTRMSRAEDMGTQMMNQLLGDRRVLWVATGLLTVLGLVPGMPNFAFLLMASICGAGAWWTSRQPDEPTVETAVPAEGTSEPDPLDAELTRELTWEDVGEAEPVSLDVGYRLIPLVDKNQGGELMRRIKGVRRRVSEELGFLVSPVRIRDDLELSATSYRIGLLGSAIAQAEVQLDKELAINPGHIDQPIEGIPTQDPAFGLDAVWIDPAQREEAQGRGYTVVDVATVIATHLSKVLQDNAHELLGHQETQELLDRLARNAPKLVEELVPKTLPLSAVVRVLQELLRDQIPITNMRSICQVLAEHGRNTQDPDALVAQVRQALGRAIVQRVGGDQEELPVITLDPDLEQMLQRAVEGDGGGIEPTLAEKVQSELAAATQRQEIAGEPAVLLVSPGLRAWLARLLRFAVPSLRVLAYSEVPDSKRIRLVAAVGA